MADKNRLGQPGERNPNEAQDENGSTQGTEPGTGAPSEGQPAGPAPTSPVPGGDTGGETAGGRTGR